MRTHLDADLAALTPAEQDVAARLFRYLVTPLRDEGRAQRLRPRRLRRRPPRRVESLIARPPGDPRVVRPGRRGRLRDLPRRPRRARSSTGASALRDENGRSDAASAGASRSSPGRRVTLAAVAVAIAILALLAWQAALTGAQREDQSRALAEASGREASTRTSRGRSPSRCRPPAAADTREAGSALRGSRSHARGFTLLRRRRCADTTGPCGARRSTRASNLTVTGGDDGIAPYLGHRERSDAPARLARPPGFVETALQPRRQAASSPRAVTTPPALGRGQRRGAGACAGTRLGQLGRLQPRRRPRRDRQWRQTPPASGTPPPASSCAGLTATGPVNARRLQPRRRPVVTASDDQTARIWDAASGEELRRPARPHGRSSSAPSARTARASSPPAMTRPPRLGRGQRRGAAPS